MVRNARKNWTRKLGLRDASIATRDLGIKLTGQEDDTANIQRMMINIFRERYAGFNAAT